MYIYEVKPSPYWLHLPEIKLPLKGIFLLAALPLLPMGVELHSVYLQTGKAPGYQKFLVLFFITALCKWNIKNFFLVQEHAGGISDLQKTQLSVKCP